MRREVVSPSLTRGKEMRFHPKFLYLNRRDGKRVDFRWDYTPMSGRKGHLLRMRGPWW